MLPSVKLLRAIGARFQDMKRKQKDLSMFAMPFNVEPADVHDNLQREIVELQSIDELKAQCNHVPLLEF